MKMIAWDLILIGTLILWATVPTFLHTVLTFGWGMPPAEVWFATALTSLFIGSGLFGRRWRSRRTHVSASEITPQE